MLNIPFAVTEANDCPRDNLPDSTAEKVSQPSPSSIRINHVHRIIQTVSVQIQPINMLLGGWQD